MYGLEKSDIDVSMWDLGVFADKFCDVWTFWTEPG